MGFSDVTGHVLAPVGELLAWLCIGLSCKKPQVPALTGHG